MSDESKQPTAGPTIPITFVKENDHWQCLVGSKSLRPDSLLARAVYHCLEEVGAIDLINASELIAEKLEAKAPTASGKIETTISELEQLARK